jgi:hypothetical protein
MDEERTRPPAPREERLAAALRANLSRRKAQARGRRENDTNGPDRTPEIGPQREGED